MGTFSSGFVREFFRGVDRYNKTMDSASWVEEKTLKAEIMGDGTKELTEQSLKAALIEIAKLEESRGEKIYIRPTHLLLKDPSLYEAAVIAEKAAREAYESDGA